MIELIGVTARYKNGFIGLNNVSFRINEGEFVYVIGETGSGKSTVIRLLHGELYPQAGSVRVGRFMVNKVASRRMPFYKRTVGVIFQDFKLLPLKKVFENLLFVADCVGIPFAERRLRVKSVLDMVGLWEKRNSFPHELSGGQQQSVAVARAMMNNPKLILADEPTGNLDPVSSENILRLLHRVNAREKATILMVTHNLDLIKKVPGRVIVINKGRVIKDIPKEKVVEMLG